MTYLLIISGSSFFGASLVVLRRIHEIRQDGIKGIHGYDAYWPIDVIWNFLKETSKVIFWAVYDFVMPYLVRGVSFLSKRMYEITNRISRHFLKIHKIVEGKGEIKSNPEGSSEFLKSISDYKNEINK